jgi:hypothetical protein
MSAAMPTRISCRLLSAAFGDEIALRRDLVGLDMGDRAELGKAFVQAFKRHYFDLAPAALELAIAEGLSQAVAVSRPILTAHCEVAQRIGERLGLSEEIRKQPRTKLRALGWQGSAARAEGRRGVAGRAPHHAGAGRHCPDRRQRRRGDGRDHRQSSRWSL